MLQHEALHGGSLLNFVGKVSTVDDVADGFEAALRKKQLEVYVPYGDSWTARLAQFWPWSLPRLQQTLEKMGAKGHAKYVDQLRSRGITA